MQSLTSVFETGNRVNRKCLYAIGDFLTLLSLWSQHPQCTLL